MQKVPIEEIRSQSVFRYKIDLLKTVKFGDFFFSYISKVPFKQMKFKNYPSLWFINQGESQGGVLDRSRDTALSPLRPIHRLTFANATVEIHTLFDLTYDPSPTAK